MLRNGDRIRGEVAELADGKLVLRTDYGMQAAGGALLVAADGSVVELELAEIA